MDLKALSLALGVLLIVEAAPEDCVCVAPELCAGAVVQQPPAESACPSPAQVCCTAPEDQVPRSRRQPGNNNDAFMDDCGLATASNDIPWAVSIYQWVGDDSAIYNLLCQGVLIHPQVVLTAANCTPNLVDDDDELLVYAGETGNPQARLVTKLGRHEYYVEDNGEFDIALLFLDAAFVLGEYVRVLCLPQRNTPLDTQGCVTTHMAENTRNLRKTSMGLQDDVADCVDMLPEETKKIYNFPDYSSFCAISRESTSLCETDEGSSQACPLSSDARRLALYGVVSLALGCSDASRPVFFTNTTYFAVWIQVKLALVGLDNFAIPPASR